MINHLRDDFGVEPVCRELDLSVSAYNARLRRPKSARRRRDEQLLEHIRRIHSASGETYGTRRVHRQLRREGVHAARCTIERLMREDGLEGVIRGQRLRTTIPEPTAPRPPDLVNRHFKASSPAPAPARTPRSTPRAELVELAPTTPSSRPPLSLPAAVSHVRGAVSVRPPLHVRSPATLPPPGETHRSDTEILLEY